MNFNCQADPGDPIAGQVSWWRLINPLNDTAARFVTPSDKNVWKYGDFMSTFGVPYSVDPSDENRRSEVSDYFVAFYSSLPLEQANRQSQPSGASTNRRLRFWARIEPAIESIERPGQIQSSIQVTLSRSEYGQEFLCLAHNNQYSAPINSSIRISLNRKC